MEPSAASLMPLVDEPWLAIRPESKCGSEFSKDLPGGGITEKQMASEVVLLAGAHRDETRGEMDTQALSHRLGCTAALAGAPQARGTRASAPLRPYVEGMCGSLGSDDLEGRESKDSKLNDVEKSADVEKFLCFAGIMRMPRKIFAAAAGEGSNPTRH